MDEQQEERYVILAIDDEPFVRKLVTRVFRNTIYQVETMANAEEALAWLKKNIPDLFICDIGLPGMDGAEFVRVIRHRGLDMPILMLTSMADAETVKQLMKQGIQGYLRKPVNVQELRRRVGSVIAKWRNDRGMPLFGQEKQDADSAEVPEDFDALAGTVDDWLDEGGSPEDASAAAFVEQVDQAGAAGQAADSGAVADLTLRIDKVADRLEGQDQALKELAEVVVTLQEDMRKVVAKLDRLWNAVAGVMEIPEANAGGANAGGADTGSNDENPDGT